ncbi:protein STRICTOSIDINE SYNTHASE-LIKE 10-like [Cucurbita pepo subsp. pepo]|uniref:protein STRICTOSIDINE SYNTHASE-LIKE 10-like n=1 Tax=Cucurbita pepo subsp. pepo TaxID=3664 RepID=UPI000C9D8CF4|nr:protein STRICTOSIDINE SYNTHASE-LIKE 10-like [Cucurbita pepo subsp. pepo]
MKESLAICSCSLSLVLWVVVAAVVSWSPLSEAAIEAVELPGGVFGPESIAFDCRGEGPYAGVGDGRILKWNGSDLGWTQFAYTSPNREGKECNGEPQTEAGCGRPLGLKFHPSTCELFIADAYFGLLAVGPQGGLARQLVSSAQGVPLRFTNALDIDPQNGVVYFTDSSLLFQRSVWILSIVNGDRTGRLLKYDPRTKNVTILINGLAFPNGVALSTDSSFLLMAETGTLQILKFWLKGPKAQTTEIFAQLERFPDNIKRTDNGEFWIAMNTGRGKLETQTWMGLGGATTQHGEVKIPWIRADPVAVKVDERGGVKGMIDGEEGQALESVSEVEERKGRLWIGSAVKPYVGFIING